MAKSRKRRRSPAKEKLHTPHIVFIILGILFAFFVLFPSIRIAATETLFPTPTPYPTVVVRGLIRTYLQVPAVNSCTNSVTTPEFTLNMAPSSPAGVFTNCGVTPAPDPLSGVKKDSFRCTAIFDNQNTPDVDPSQDLIFVATAQGYQSGYLAPVPNGCRPDGERKVSVDVSSGASTVYDQTLLFRAF